MVPQILELFPNTASVVDLGCGTGVWLHNFKAKGVPRVLGLDGGISEDGMLLLRHDEFRSVNLSEPVRLPERFDLALSLEVAEHLPPRAAQTFVASLCRLSDLAIFGAAIPGQSGTWHVNERWPSYWAALFDAEGYELFDILRPLAWYDQRVEWWYAQNSLVFVRRSRDDLGQIARTVAARQDRPNPLDLVHPRCFETFRRSLEVQNTALVTAQEKITAYELRITQAEAQADRADAHATEMAAQADRAIAQAAAANAQLAAVLRSTSWRIMGPMRWVFAPMWRTARSVVRTFSRPPRTNLARRSHER